MPTEGTVLILNHSLNNNKSSIQNDSVDWHDLSSHPTEQRLIMILRFKQQ